MMGWEESFFKCPYLASAGPDDSWRRWTTEHQQFLAWGYSNDGLIRSVAEEILSGVQTACWLLAFCCGPWGCIRCRWVHSCSMSTFSRPIPVSNLKVSIRSPLIFFSQALLPSLCRPNLDSYGNFFNVDTILVAVLWTLSRICTTSLDEVTMPEHSIPCVALRIYAWSLLCCSRRQNKTTDGLTTSPQYRSKHAVTEPVCSRASTDMHVKRLYNGAGISSQSQLCWR